MTVRVVTIAYKELIIGRNKQRNALNILGVVTDQIHASVEENLSQKLEIALSSPTENNFYADGNFYCDLCHPLIYVFEKNGIEKNRK